MCYKRDNTSKCSVCMCVCACVCVSACVCVCVSACVGACVCAHMYACVRGHMCVLFTSSVIALRTHVNFIVHIVDHLMNTST